MPARQPLPGRWAFVVPGMFPAQQAKSMKRKTTSSFTRVALSRIAVEALQAAIELERDPGRLAERAEADYLRDGAEGAIRALERIAATLHTVTKGGPKADAYRDLLQMEPILDELNAVLVRDGHFWPVRALILARDVYADSWTQRRAMQRALAKEGEQ